MYTEGAGCGSEVEEADAGQCKREELRQARAVGTEEHLLDVAGGGWETLKEVKERKE